MKKNLTFKQWEPYELEALGFGSLRHFKRSRERLFEKLGLFDRRAAKAKEISDWMKQVMEKNGGKLF